MEKTDTGRTAVITGGARGFGKAFGEALAQRGATVALIDLDGAEAEKTAAKIGHSAMAFAGDVTDEARMNEVMKEIADRTGGIDILINNAGLHSSEYNRPLKTLGLSKIKRLFDVNILGIVVVTFAATPFMAGRPGANILNISSVSAYTQTGYGVSKLAVLGLTTTFSLDLAADEIRVNAIAPGVILTEYIKETLPQETIARIKAQQHVKRNGAEQDIVNAMLYLTSDQASFVTGETLRVSGGFMAGI